VVVGGGQLENGIFTKGDWSSLVYCGGRERRGEAYLVESEN
jgi:hypothetical protein